LWTADGKNCLSCRGCTYSVNENEEFLFEIASVWKYMIGSVSRWIVVSMRLSVCESLRNQGEQEAVWVLEMESYQQVWNRFVEHRRQGPHQMVYASSVFTGPLLFGYTSTLLCFHTLCLLPSHYLSPSHTLLAKLAHLVKFTFYSTICVRDNSHWSSAF